MKEFIRNQWDVNLAVDLGKIQIKNPVMTASGTFGYGSELKNLLNPAEFGAICTKSITLDARDGNSPPRIAELPYGMLNSIGLANIGIISFLRDKLAYLNSLDTNIIVNVVLWPNSLLTSISPPYR